MKYSLKTKTFFSLLIILGVFVFNNLILIQDVNAGSITGTTTNSSDQFPHNGTTTISGTISMSAGTVSSQKINGIDGGGLTISSGSTLQLNAYSTFVINPGSKITNNGGILNNIIPGGAKIVKGYLWAKDADNDGCLDPATVKYNDSATVAPVAGYERVRDLLYIEPSSADDNNPGAGPGCVGTLTIGSFTANPTVGNTPLIVTFTVTIGGNAIGDIRYRFDYNTSDSTYDTDDTVSATTYSKTYTYTTAGTYTANVEVTRGGITRTATPINITVNNPCPNCQTNKTDSCDGLCATTCGASSSCDNRAVSSTWVSGNYCYWCNSSCTYGSSTTKPTTYYLSGGTCYYNCSIVCQINGWARGSCSNSVSCQAYASGSTCYYNPQCGSSGCTYSSSTNKQCSTSVCTSSGWNNSSCPRYDWVPTGKMINMPNAPTYWSGGTCGDGCCSSADAGRKGYACNYGLMCKFTGALRVPNTKVSEYICALQ